MTGSRVTGSPRFLGTGAVALCLALGLTAYGWLLQLAPQRELAVGLAVTFTLAVGGTVLVARPLLTFVRRELLALPRGWRRAVLALALSLPAALAVVAPLRLPSFEGPIRIEVIPREGRGEGREIWLQDARFDATPEPFEGMLTRFAGGSRLADEGWQPGPGWTLREGVWLATSTSAGPLHWVGRGVWEKVSLRFSAHAWSGAVEVRQGWSSQRVSLTRVDPTSVSVTLRLVPQGPALAAWLLWGVAHWALLTLLILATILALGRATVDSRRSSVPLWGPFLIVMLGQFLYLAAFHPGLMSSDSVDQWQQGMRGPLIGAHPPIHTLLHRVLGGIFGTPAAVVVLQQAAYALVISLWARELGRRGASRGMVWGMTLVAAFWIVPGVLLSTLWKDIPYSLGILALTYGLFRQTSSEGHWLSSRRARLGMVAAISGVMLLRHNGLLAGAATLAALLTLGGSRRNVATVAALSVGVVLLVRGPLERALQVEPTPRSFALQNQVHQMAALMSDDAAFSDTERAMLAEIQPLEVWRDQYICYTLSPTFYNAQFNHASFDANTRPFVSALLRQARERPMSLVERQLCVTSYVWRILQPESGYLYTHTRGIDPNNAGLAPTPLLPDLRSWLLTLLDASTKPGSATFLMWRPALWHYVVLLGAFLLALRQRDVQLIWLAVPVLANAGSLLVLSPSQSMRYAFSAQLVGLLIPVLCSLPFMKRQDCVGVASAHLDPARLSVPAVERAPALPASGSGGQAGAA